MSKPQSNASSTTPGWMMVIACLLMAAMISGILEETPTNQPSVSNFATE